MVAAPRLTNFISGRERNATSIFEAAYGGQLLAPFELSAQKKMTITVK